jgi:hypothetical protein
MSKYRNLTLHLASRDDKLWETTFNKVEEVLGMHLPDSARKHRPWWANDGHAQSTAWLGAGWKTANVDMTNETLTFVYAGDGVGRQVPEAPMLTIGEAKAGLAANFGVSVDAVEITIRG